MRTDMAEGRKKSVYNERFLFDDPLDRVSGSHSTRYRLTKKRKAEITASLETHQETDDGDQT